MHFRCPSLPFTAPCLALQARLAERQRHQLAASTPPPATSAGADTPHGRVTVPAGLRGGPAAAAVDWSAGAGLGGQKDGQMHIPDEADSGEELDDLEFLRREREEVLGMVMRRPPPVSGQQ